MNLICAVFGHRRSGERTRYDGSVWRSVCQLCGRAMIAHAPGAWKLDRDERDGE